MRETTCGLHVNSFHPRARSWSAYLAISTAVSSLHGSSQHGDAGFGSGWSSSDYSHVSVFCTEHPIRLTSQSHSLTGVMLKRGSFRCGGGGLYRSTLLRSRPLRRTP